MTTLLPARIRVILLPLLLGVGGCEDAIGFGGSCTAAMGLVRRQENGPPLSNPRTERNGDFTEIWRYPDSVYTFRWGASYVGCEVSGPEPLSAVLFLD